MATWDPFYFYILLALLPLVSCNLVRRYHFDAILYEEYSTDSRYIQFSRTDPEEWKDLDKLREKHGLSKISMLCTRGRGSWFAFPEPNFQIGDSLYYTLIVGENCLPIAGIQSLQPIGQIKEIHDEMAVLYSVPHFGSDQTMLIEDPVTSVIQSLVFFGDSELTVEVDGTKFCLETDHQENVTCIVSVLNGQLQTGVPDKTVSLGCPDKEHLTTSPITIQTCYHPGVHQIRADVDFSYTKLHETCEDGAKKADKITLNKIRYLMEIWQARAVRSRNTIEPLPASEPEVETRQLVLNRMLDILLRGCPNIQMKYAEILLNIFTQHMRILVQGSEKNFGEETSELDGVIDYFKDCTNHLNELLEEGTDPETYSCSEDQEAEVMATESELNAFDEMMKGTKKDVVFEQIWLATNFATSYCNLHNKVATNTWLQVKATVSRNLLDPFLDQWENPGPWQKLYVSMFSGYDIGKAHQDLLVCNQRLLGKGRSQSYTVTRPLPEDVELAGRSFSRALLE